MAYNIEGMTFNFLKVIKEVGRYPKNGEKIYLCECLRCGGQTEQRSSFIRKGATKDTNGYSRGVLSCGCYFRNMVSEMFTTHGFSMSDNPLAESTYNAWNNMFVRCYSKNDPGYRHYGGLGIGVHEPWQKFEEFLKDVGIKPGDGYDLARLDLDKNYEPGNVVWRKSRLRLQKSRRAKLTIEQVRELRQLAAQKVPRKELARKYNITQAVVSNIINYKIWKEF